MIAPGTTHLHAERVFVRVNGVRQGMFIKSTDAAGPVLLFLHGGPGMPELLPRQDAPDRSRGRLHRVLVGAARRRDLLQPRHPPGVVTTEQLIRDTIAVTDHLRERFGREGSTCWGTPGAASSASRWRRGRRTGTTRTSAWARSPISRRSEVLAYEYAQDRFRKAGDTRSVRKLEAAPVTMDAPLPRAYMKVRDAVMHRLGVGTTRDMRSVVTGVFVPVWRTPGYTVGRRSPSGAARRSPGASCGTTSWRPTSPPR